MKCSVAVLLLSASVASALYTAQQPVSVQWDQRNGKGDAYNVDTSLYPFARVAKGAQPEQINIVYQAPTSVVVSWITGNAQYVNAANASLLQRPNLAGVQSIVQYAAKGAKTELNATGMALTFDQNYYVPGYDDYNWNYTSGVISHVALANLTPSTEYYYRVGNGQNWSLPHTFTTLPAVTANFTPYRIGVLADLGVTANSTVTFNHLTESLPDVVTLIGDFNYADNLVPNGSIAKDVNYTGSVSLTYPPLWDSWGRWWSTLTSTVPFLAANGNHEYEQDAYGNTFNAFNARYNQTSDLSKSGNSRYYSVELPGIHLISLSPYDPYNATSPQYMWLQKDLASFSRQRTPFLVIQFHTPMFNTYVSHYKEVECARLAWEPLFYQYGADLILHGHVHSYERTTRVFDYNVNPCAATWITVGDAGNMEQLAVPWADDPGNCPAITLASSPGSKFQGNCLRYSLQSQNANATNNGFCPTQQPAWSAYREPSFGHGTLEVSNSQLVWNWHRNQDAEPIITDTFTVVPKDASCPNANGPMATAPSLGAPSPSGAAGSGPTAAVSGR